MKKQKIYVLDTNIILADALNIQKISENGKNLIILPQTVIDEIDSKKYGKEEINYHSRHFARLLFEAKKIDKFITYEYTRDNKKSIVKIVKIFLNDIEIHMISMDNYYLKDVERSILNDRKIIEVAKFVESTYKGVNDKINKDITYIESTFLTLDGMCYISAMGEGLKTESLLYDKKDLNPTFIKTIETKKQIKDGMSILTLDKEYKKENYCYIFENPISKKETLSIIKDGNVSIIEDSLFSKVAVKPKNNGQRFALAGMLDNSLDIVLVDALAGSGKTLLAIAAAMRCIDTNQLNSDKKFDKIIYIRNSIESVDQGEEVGFLSGNEEKFKIYNLPLYDTVNFLAALTLKNSKKAKGKDKEEAIENKANDMFSKYKIETMWVGSIRGRTIRDAYIIVDEIQNFSKKSLQTVLTRIDENCKIIAIGSNRQIDNSYVNKYTNGLNTLLKESIKENKGISLFATSLTKVERGKLTAWAESIFS